MWKSVRVSVLAGVVACLATAASGQEKPGKPERLEGRAVWAHWDEMRSPAAVTRLVENCRKAHVKLIMMRVKDASGRIAWKSEKFSNCVLPTFRSYDGLADLVKKAHAVGIKVHAWLSAYVEGPESPAYKEHPEWAARGPDGAVTTSERVAGGAACRTIYMCPARRPGYTDGWLLPLLDDLLRSHEVDGVHLSDLCYPGGLAPDRYCFCDYCVEHFFKHNHFGWEFTERRFPPAAPLAPTPAANWWKEFTVRPDPKTWKAAPTKVKAEFLLSGSSVWDSLRDAAVANRHDMDYFWYDYRCDAIKRAVREAWEHVNRARPGMEFSAAVYKNPKAAGRYLGQRWTDWAQFVDVMMPTLYRSHFPGTFEQYLKMLEEYARYERYWTEGLCYAYVGLAVDEIYREETEALDAMVRLLKIDSDATRDRKNVAALLAMDAEKLKALCGSLEAEYARFASRLRKAVPEQAKELDSALLSFKQSIGGEVRGPLQALRKRLALIHEDPPRGFFSGGKLRACIDAVRRGGCHGIAIFRARVLDRYKLWDALSEAFAQPAEEPYLARPLRVPSAQSVRLLGVIDALLAKRNVALARLSERMKNVGEARLALAERVGALEREKKDLGATIERLQKKVNDTLASLEKEKKRHREEFDREKAEADRLHSQLQDARAELASARADLKRLKKSSRDAEQLLVRAEEQKRRLERRNELLQSNIEKAERESVRRRDRERLMLVIIFGVLAAAFAVALLVMLVRRRAEG